MGNSIAVFRMKKAQDHEIGACGQHESNEVSTTSRATPRLSLDQEVGPLGHYGSNEVTIVGGISNLSLKRLHQLLNSELDPTPHRLNTWAGRGATGSNIAIEKRLEGSKDHCCSSRGRRVLVTAAAAAVVVEDEEEEQSVVEVIPPQTSGFELLLTSDCAVHVLGFLSLQEVVKVLSLCFSQSVSSTTIDNAWILSLLRTFISKKTNIGTRCILAAKLGDFSMKGLGAYAKRLVSLPTSFNISMKHIPSACGACDAFCGECNEQFLCVVETTNMGEKSLLNALSVSRFCRYELSQLHQVRMSCKRCKLDLLIAAQRCDIKNCNTMTTRICDFCAGHSGTCVVHENQCDNCSHVCCEDCTFTVESVHGTQLLCGECSFVCNDCLEAYNVDDIMSCSSQVNCDGELFCSDCWSGFHCTACEELKCAECGGFNICEQCGLATCNECIGESSCEDCGDNVCGNCGWHF